jgi:8-oxo-dGTP diphosphatase
MMDRTNFPYGWACPAGHIDKNETPEEAVVRETREETGIKILKQKLLINEFIEWNECSKGIRGHNWFVFKTTKWEGVVKKSDREAKEIRWVGRNEIENLKLEPVWAYWFKKLKILK